MQGHLWRSALRPPSSAPAQLRAPSLPPPAGVCATVHRRRWKLVGCHERALASHSAGTVLSSRRNGPRGAAGPRVSWGPSTRAGTPPRPPRTSKVWVSQPPEDHPHRPLPAGSPAPPSQYGRRQSFQQRLSHGLGTKSWPGSTWDNEPRRGMEGPRASPSGSWPSPPLTPLVQPL